ncbi:diguanylate cyclase/phosphodiesterase [Marinomonas alcarazii]|uniref:Diguanylate cyclase/phosphodiesterase n=1 Tax=Marinomonas alcarazii TaxID=491949 RepID=A0A318V7F6_9GAMM|nr:EAL domain-containing protein [Marinomonas alcarazii]PYF84554.1 diguanylate cyclase/phosphodiesterase [Marinomonas alcarazii]
MSLNKRLILLLLPVILLGYGVSTYLVYQYQKSNVIELEQAKLEQRMYQLQGIFKEEASTVDSLMALFLEGGYLSNFLQSTSSSYRDIALSQSLTLLTTQAQLNRNPRVSFALFSGDGEELFYFERSSDPFATISDEQNQMSMQMIKNRVSTDWRLFNDTSPSTVIRGRLLDKLALVPFKGRDVKDSIQLSFAVRMDMFSDYLESLKQSYQATIEWESRPTLFVNELGYSIRLSPSQFLTLKPNDSVLAKPLSQLSLQLTAIALFLAVFTFGLLVTLISRFITAPIGELDKELTQVMNYQKDNISLSANKSEIGQLSKKFHNLFEQLQSNLKKTHEMAITDTLTALPNRFRFYEYSRHVLAKANQENALVSLVYIDLDNFKFVNDKLGHEAGDDLLCFLAQDLQRLIEPILKQRGGCMASRLSGDEFAIVLTHATVKEVDDLAKSVVALFEGGYESDQYYFPVSASMGIASFPKDGKTLKELIANADMAMYNAKRSGKNCYSYYSVNIAAGARRTKMIEDALKMIDCDEEFFLVYMPYTDADDHIKGFEVLIRWNSPELGVIHPDEFIPIAEQTGSYAKIDRWVFETAFKSLPKVRRIFGEECILSINISAAELSHHSVLQHLDELKSQYQIDDKSIELELTETFSYVQTGSVFDVLNGLQNSGFSIAIDDFGVGYTPLLHMIDYPVNKVKLDKVLTERITDSQYAKLLPPLIQLCHLQDIVVTAEGIEDTFQLQCLKEAGCDFFQGFWLSKPMPLEELEDWYHVYRNKTPD